MRNNKTHRATALVLLLLMLITVTGCATPFDNLYQMEELTATAYNGAFKLCKAVHSEVVDVEYTESLHESNVTFANNSELSYKIYDNNRIVYIDCTLKFSSNEMTKENIAEFIDSALENNDVDYTEVLDSYEKGEEITKSYELGSSILDIKLTYEDNNFYKLQLTAYSKTKLF